MRIAVAGGTGTVGAHVVTVARRRGHEPLTLSRAGGVDLRTGESVSQMLAGAEVVIDVLSVPTTAAARSADFFRATTTTLLTAERAAGTPHHVALSIVGVDRAPDGYYAGKLVQEKLVETGPVPWTILPATQFHEFAAQMFERARIGPLHLAPRMRTQPIAAIEVAERLIDIAEAGPSGRAEAAAGPREEDLPAMIRAYARIRGHRGPIPALPFPGGMGRAQRDGSLLPGAGAILGRQTFGEWLSAQPAG